MISNIETELGKKFRLEGNMKGLCIILHLENGYKFNGMPLEKIVITYTDSIVHYVEFFGVNGMQEGKFRGDDSMPEVIAFALENARNNND